jgi:hypothetical protein
LGRTSKTNFKWQERKWELKKGVLSPYRNAPDVPSDGLLANLGIIHVVWVIKLVSQFLQYCRSCPQGFNILP